MTAATGKGTAMHIETVKVRFVAGERIGRRPKGCLDGRVAEVRKLLRTDKTIRVIADELGVNAQFLMKFIKRRRICDVNERRKFITLQDSIRKLEAAQ